MTTITTTNAETTLKRSTYPSPWQASRGSKADVSAELPRMFLGLVPQFNFGIRKKTTETIQNMTIVQAPYKGEAG